MLGQQRVDVSPVGLADLRQHKARVLPYRVNAYRGGTAVTHQPTCCASCPRRPPRCQTLVVLPEQVERLSDILLAPQVVTDLPCLRQHVVNLRLARLDQFLSHPHRERKISQPVAVQVPDLMPIYPKLHPTEPVTPRLDPRPSRYLTLDRLSDARHVPLLTPMLFSRLNKHYHRRTSVHRTKGGISPVPWYGPIRLMQSQQQCRDRDHGHRCRDQDSAGGTDDVDVVLAGDNKDVGGDGEGCTEQGCGSPEGIDAEDYGGREEEGSRVEYELHERHIGDFGRASRHGASSKGGAEGEQGAGACCAAEQIEEVAQRRWGVESCGRDGKACEDGEYQGISGEGGEGDECCVGEAFCTAFGGLDNHDAERDHQHSVEGETDDDGDGSLPAEDSGDQGYTHVARVRQHCREALHRRLGTSYLEELESDERGQREEGQARRHVRPDKRRVDDLSYWRGGHQAEQEGRQGEVEDERVHSCCSGLVKELQASRAVAAEDQSEERQSGVEYRLQGPLIVSTSARFGLSGLRFSARRLRRLLSKSARARIRHKLKC